MTPNNIKPDSANNDVKQEEHITFSVHDLIQTVIANWYWFVISVIVCVGCSYIYILRTPKIYSRTANILVKDSRKGGDTNLAALSDLAGLSQMRNVDNEIYILQSRRLMTEVVKQLGLTVQYETKEGLRPQDLYGQNPIAVDFINDNDRQGFRFEVSLYPDSIVKLNRFEIFGPDKQKFKQEITGMFGDTISTPVGQMIIRPTLYMSSDYYEKAPIRVTKGNLGVVTQFYQHEVKSFVANKQASIITISMRSSVPKKAEDVINTLIAVYEKDAIDDKRGIAESTGQFIDNRLAIISGELSEVDRNIEKFKKDNKIYDIVSEAEQTITESAQYKVDGLSLENQIRMTEFLKEYLLDPAKANELIPGTLSINSPAINTQIDAYNTELQRYMKLNSDNSGNNPIVQDLGNGLASTRRSIIATLDSYISTLQIQLAALRREEALTNQRISSVPTQEKQILDIVRQQKIKEELYLYLLNKREDLNAIEIALGMQRLIDECNLTQEALSEKVGKKRSTVSNYMRLLKLPNEVQLALKEGLISMGHAKAIAGAPEELQLRLLKKCIRKGLSVRQIEELVRALTDPAAKPAAPAEDEEYPESYARLVEQLEKFFSQEISIKRSKNGGGRIVIDFSDDRDIDRFIEKFEKRGASAEIRNNK